MGSPWEMEGTEGRWGSGQWAQVAVCYLCKTRPCNRQKTEALAHGSVTPRSPRRWCGEERAMSDPVVPTTTFKWRLRPTGNNKLAPGALVRFEVSQGLPAPASCRGPRHCPRPPPLQVLWELPQSPSSPVKPLGCSVIAPGMRWRRVTCPCPHTWHDFPRPQALGVLGEHGVWAVGHAHAGTHPLTSVLDTPRVIGSRLPTLPPEPVPQQSIALGPCGGTHLD